MTSLINDLIAFGAVLAILGGGVRAVSKLTRIADAVDRLSGNMEHAMSQIGEHEKRITRLELLANFPPRSGP